MRTPSYSTPDAQLSNEPLGPNAPEATESKNTLGPAASKPRSEIVHSVLAPALRTNTCWPSTRKLCLR